MAKNQPIGDWRKHDLYRKHHQRHQELAASIPKLADRRREGGPLHRDQASAQARHERAQLEQLAGRAQEADVLALERSAIEAKRQYALAVLAHEDACEEHRKVGEAVAKARKAAKEEAAAVLRQRYQEALAKVRDAILAAIAADEEMAAVINSAREQFPHVYQGNADEDGFPHGLGLPRDFNRLNAEPALNSIEKALDAMKRRG